MDLTKLSDADLLALKAGDYAKMSDDGLKQLKASSGSEQEPSGAAAGFMHNAEELVRGPQETAKQFAGVGSGADAPSDPGYVPAKVINGWNPLKWNYGQLPQKIAEAAPGLAESSASAAAGSKVGGMFGPKGRLVGGLIGAAAPYVLNNAGVDAKANAARRTGDDNAEPNLGDKVRAGLTDTTAGLVQGIGPMRFIPGGAVAKTLGTAGVKEAAKKYVTTVGDNALGGAAGDLATQIGNTIGTDKGVQVDPGRTLDAAAGNAGAAALMGVPRLAASTHTAVSQRKFDGANSDATSAYFNRLQANAGAEGLGNAKNDFAAHENTKANLRQELQAVDDSGFGQDTQNTMALARAGKPLTEDHVKSIEAADPAAGYLARQLYAAQHAETFGSMDRANKSWAGGTSGLADKYAVRPFKSHALISAAAGLGGVHMLGSYAVPTLASAAAVYGGARAVDNLTGMRSPAKGLAERYADANVPTRLAPPPPPAAAPLPTNAPPGPWGPRPSAPPQTVPQVAPPQAPQPGTQPWSPPTVTQLPQMNPMAMMMLKQKLKQGLPPEPEQPPAPAPITPGTEPWKAPSVTEIPQQSPMALQMLKAKLKAGLPPGPQWKAPTVAELPQPPAPPAPPEVNPLKLPTDVTGPAKNLMNGLGAAQARNPTGAVPIVPPKVTASALKAKITKSDGGTVKVTAAPQPAPASLSAAAAPTSFYRPLAPEEMQFGGKASEMRPEQIGRAIADKHMADKPEEVRQRYANSTADTHAERRAIVQDVISRHPDHVLPLMKLLEQLHERGKAEQAKSAIEHYGKQASPEVHADLLSGFNDEAMKRIWATRAEKKAASRAKKKNANKAQGEA